MDLNQYFKDFTGLFYDSEFIDCLINRNTKVIIKYIRKNTKNLNELINEYDDKFFGLKLSPITGMRKELDLSSKRVLYLNNKNVDLLFSLFHFKCHNSNENIDIISDSDLDQEIQDFFSKHLNIEDIIEINFLYSEIQDNFNPSLNPANFYSFSLVLLYLCESIFCNLKTVKIGLDTTIIKQELIFVDLHAHYLALFYYIYISEKKLNVLFNLVNLEFHYVQNYTYNSVSFKQLEKYTKITYLHLDYLNILNSALLINQNFQVIHFETILNYDVLIDCLRIVENSKRERGFYFKCLSIKTSCEMFKNESNIKQMFINIEEMVKSKPIDIELNFEDNKEEIKWNKQDFAISLEKLLSEIVKSNSSDVKFLIKVPNWECFNFDNHPFNNYFRFKKFTIISKLFEPNILTKFKFFSINSKSIKLHILDERIFSNINKDLVNMIKNNKDIRSLDLKVIENKLDKGKYKQLKELSDELIYNLKHSNLEKFKLIIISDLTLKSEDLNNYLEIFKKSKLRKFSMILEKDEDSLSRGNKLIMMSPKCYFYKEELKEGNTCTFFIQNSEEF